jgi:transporter family-2 protein
MNWLYVMLAVVAGVCVTVQTGVNARLRGHLESAPIVGLINFVVGAAAMAVIVLAMRAPVPSAEAARSAPAWTWVGGVLGATLVTLSIIAAPKIGTAGLAAGLIAGQIVASLVLDHVDAFGLGARPVTWMRVGGAALIAVGMAMVVWGRGEK